MGLELIRGVSSWHKGYNDFEGRTLYQICMRGYLFRMLWFYWNFCVDRDFKYPSIDGDDIGFLS